MNFKKDNNSIWSMSYNYSFTPETQKYFYDFANSDAQLHYEVEKELELLNDIDLWVDIMDGDYPEATAIINKIMDK